MSLLRQTQSAKPYGRVSADVSAQPTWPDVEPASVVHRCSDNSRALSSAGMSISMVGALSGPSPTDVLDSEVSFERFISLWANDSGLFRDDGECPGASRYIQTAYQLFPETELRQGVAKYMLLVAIGDVLLDKRLEGETQENHRERIGLSVDYLRRALYDGVERVHVPDVPGAAILAVVAQQWQLLLWRYAGHGSSDAMRQWIRALDDHYVASFREWLPEVVENPLIADLRGAGASKIHAMEVIRARYGQVDNVAIASRIDELLSFCRQSVVMGHPALLELRLWMYLLDVNTIGAGLAFRTAAMALAESRVPAQGLVALQKTLSLLDMRIRLANDASGFFENAGQDRDEGKVNSCSLLISDEREGENGGVVRDLAIERAKQILGNVCGRIDAQLDAEILALTQQWPEMGQWVARGRKIGVRTYEVGHYTTLDREAFTSLLEAS